MILCSVAGSENPAGHNRTDLSKPEQPVLVELLQELSLSCREEIFFMQLPDCMPGRACAQADHSAEPITEKPAKKEVKSEHKTTRPAGLKAQVSESSSTVTSPCLFNLNRFFVSFSHQFKYSKSYFS